MYFFYLIEQHSKFLWHTLQALYMCTLCDSTNINTKIRVRSKLFVASQHATSSLQFAAILVNCAPSGETQTYCTPHIFKKSFENFLIHRCNYILLSQVCCVWQVVKTPTIILNNPVYMNYRWYQIIPQVEHFYTNRSSAKSWLDIYHWGCRPGCDWANTWH